MLGMTMKHCLFGLLVVLALMTSRYAPAANPSAGATAGGSVLYSCDFQNAEVGKVPEDLMVLDGAFAVGLDNSNKFLELPGTPLDNFGVLFGPAAITNVTVNGRVFGTNKGRRQPVFGVGLGGAGGFRLMVAPGRGTMDLFRGDALLASKPFAWVAGKWTHLALELAQTKPGTWKVSGKAWIEGTAAPGSWTISAVETNEISVGRSSIWGSPISGTPIRFDDLKLIQGAVGR
jgi:hypothetical protein